VEASTGPNFSQTANVIVTPARGFCGAHKIFGEVNHCGAISNAPNPSRALPMKQSHVIRNYYVLPCCLLLLNLCVEMVSYKARMFGDPMLRTAAIMGMVLFGGSAVGFVVAPAITKLVGGLHRQSRQGAGELGGVLFLVLLGVAIFYLYYRVYILGPESVLPHEWWNRHLPK
jgi:hypothetical protein